MAALSSAPLTFLIADYVQYGQIDYIITTPFVINTSASLSNDYYCTYNKMIIQCSLKQSSPPDNLCYFLNSTTFEKIHNATSISISRASYTQDYDVQYWTAFDLLMWFGCIAGFWFVLISFCIRNALIFKFHLYSKLAFMISCIVGFICLFMVGLMGTFEINHDQNCRNGMETYLEKYVNNGVDLNINVEDITANIGQSVIFFIVLCGLDMFILLIMSGFSMRSDWKNKKRIQRYKDRSAKRKETESEIYHCPCCHDKGYYYGLFFEKTVCIDCKETEYLMKYTDKSKPKYSAIGSVNDLMSSMKSVK